MKKFFKVFIILACIIGLVAPVQAAFKDMWASVYTWDGDMAANGLPELTHVTSGITFKVLQRNSDTAETLYEYNDNAYTSLTNPITTTNFESATVCDDKVMFRVDPGETTDTYVDLIVVNTAGGYTAFVEDFTETVHTIVIDERPGITHHGCIWFSYNSVVETDTEIDFDYDTLIEHVIVETVTVDAGETLDVGLLSSGTNGDLDGLVDGTSVATAGYTLITLTTSGALMDDGTNFDPCGHAVVSADEQSLTYTGSSGSNTSAGYIHYLITRMR